MRREPDYIFPELERTVFTRAGKWLAVMELILHGFFVGTSIYWKTMDGIWISLGFAVFFGLIHWGNLRARKYCLAKWSADDGAIYVHIGDEVRSVALDGPFCAATSELAFGRRYGMQKYPFILLWKPGETAPYTQMHACLALQKRQALVLPWDEEVLALLAEKLRTAEIPAWPRSAVRIK